MASKIASQSKLIAQFAKEAILKGTIYLLSICGIIYYLSVTGRFEKNDFSEKMISLRQSIA